MTDASGRVDAARAGWNACRKSIYTVCEDAQPERESHRSDTENAPLHYFGRGYMAAAKSIARGFNSMEAEDDDNFQALLRDLDAQGLPPPPIDVARVREVLKPFAAFGKFVLRVRRDAADKQAWYQTDKAALRYGDFRALDALLRDLDAQGAAPAGWRPIETFGSLHGGDPLLVEAVADLIVLETDATKCAFRVARKIIQLVCERLAAAPVSPSPAQHAPTIDSAPKNTPFTVDFQTTLENGVVSEATGMHAPTVEACVAQLRRLYDEVIKQIAGLKTDQGGPWLAGKAAGYDVGMTALRALTSGAEAGERGEEPDNRVRFVTATGGDPEDEVERLSREDSDRGASAEPRPLSVDKTDEWDEEHIKRRSIIQLPDGSFKAVDRLPPRPLLEWSDDELWCEVEKHQPLYPNNGLQEAWHGRHGYELRMRGWRLWHGGDKAPVEGEVEVRLRDGQQGMRNDASRFDWIHTGSANHDIIAYRPVPAKAATQKGGDAPRPSLGPSLCNEAPGSAPGAAKTAPELLSRTTALNQFSMIAEGYYGSTDDSIPNVIKAAYDDTGRLWRDVAADLAAKLAAAERERDLAWTRFDKVVATLDEVAIGRARAEAALGAAQEALTPFARLRNIALMPKGLLVADLDPGENGRIWFYAGDIQRAAKVLNAIKAALPIPAAKPEGE